MMVITVDKYLMGVTN